MRLLLLILALTTPASAGIHDSWDTVLKEYSKDGWVDYARLKKDRKEVDSYLGTLRNTKPSAEKKMSRSVRLAFWINAYNALATKTILDNYPIKKGWGFAALAYPDKSIKQIKGAFDGKKHQIAGRDITLNELEDNILRGELDEPRIHFAIVCASIGCPLLRSEAYQGETIETQLDDNFISFLNSDRIQIDLEQKEIRLSKIFKWFAKDFVRFRTANFSNLPEDARGPISFASPYLNEKTRTALKKGGFSLSWLSYDWGLNDKPLN